jgi:ribosomal protein L11 methyltransferase
MSRYIQITFHPVTTEQSSILIAQLSDIGFEGFEESENALQAFIAEKNYNEEEINDLKSAREIPFEKSIVEDKDWNAVWESSFEPVIVGDFVYIRADFHNPMQGVKHELVITPKMSFGTGHHATTYMMIEQMRGIDFTGKAVFDFGTGTGVLAILAEKLGANKIVAVDNDERSIENAAENIQRNHCSKIELKKASTLLNDSFDIILANINRNVILENFSILSKALLSGGILLLSGLLKEDEDDIFRRLDAYSLQMILRSAKDNWLCLKLSH